jgi:nitric oxide reductase NorD protein
VRRSWLSLNLTADAELAAADRAAASFGPAVHARLLAAGDRLAAHSTALALVAYRQAPAVWRHFGDDGFARWLALGDSLAVGPPACREAALAFFAVAPAAFGPGGLDTAAAWCDLGREVVEVSRRLGGSYFERTASQLPRPDGVARLRPWVAAGLALHERRGWRGGFLAQAYFDGAPASVTALAPSSHERWVEVGLALGGEVDDREFFAAPPGEMSRWEGAEQGTFLAAVARLAAGAKRPAHIVYRDLPPALARTPAPVRAALLDVLARLDARVAAPLADIVPVAGAVLAGVPREHVAGALARIAALAERHPEAAVGALRVLPRLYEEARADEVGRWFEAGVAIAADNPDAGKAYFALESRTSLKVLRAASTAAGLDETQGVWRKLVQMLSGSAVTIRGVDAPGLRPPLEEVPAECEVALPVRIDWLPTHEENCRVYRFLAVQLAGRREFGTYVGHETLRESLRREGSPELLEDLFLIAEGVRIHYRAAAAYPGIGAETSRLAARLLDAWRGDPRPTRGMIFDSLLALSLAPPEQGGRPSWLPAEMAATIVGVLAPLGRPTATVDDSVAVAHRLAELLDTPVLVLPRDELPEDLLLLDDLTGGEPLDLRAPGDPAEALAQARDAARDAEAPVQLGDEQDDPGGSGRPLSADELRRLLEAGARIGQSRGELPAGEGLTITDLLGKLPGGVPLATGEEGAVGRAGRGRRGGEDGIADRAFFYDEWDHGIADYRSRWCRLSEVPLVSDSGEFFGETLSAYARLLPEVRRQFQRIRPEMYRTLRGLEDGEDFDLNAVTDARIEVRARRAPSSRLYRARVREARDVATLFLLDMSASTDEPFTKPNGERPGRRIIDALKEALVIMSEALDELGDAYAIYGFSGQGRSNVEFYLVKGFGEALGPVVKARIGGIVPKRSTRMGTALRHAVEKMNAVGARVKHLILLSDGFPQDDDYGADRRSHTYGIQDTAVALREADAAGITPFCITVDRAGHDYLRQMCDASRYMVIDDIAALPRELPKIYRRVVRA